MAGIDLRGPQIREFAVARGQSRIVIERATYVGQPGKETGMVPEQFYDVHHWNVGTRKTRIERTDLFRGLFRFN